MPLFNPDEWVRNAATVISPRGGTSIDIVVGATAMSGLGEKVRVVGNVSIHADGATNVLLRLTNGTTGIGATDGAALFLFDDGKVALWNYEATDLRLATSNTIRWVVNGTGHLVGGLDNTYDIGASGATRPRTAYIGTSVIVGPAEALGGSAFPVRSFGTVTAGFTARETTNDVEIDFGAAAGVAFFRAVSAHDLHLGTNGTHRWKLGATTGHLLAFVDNTYDIGASGATRPRDLFLGRNAVIGGALDHDGTTLGFYTVTPVVRSAGRTITNDSTLRTLDADTTDLPTICDFLATLAKDIALTGLIGAVS